jgi:hypothetical protein
LGPGGATLDLSLAEQFPVNKHRAAEIRLEAFNSLNHTNFGESGHRIRVVDRWCDLFGWLAADRSDGDSLPVLIGASVLFLKCYSDECGADALVRAGPPGPASLNQSNGGRRGRRPRSGGPPHIGLSQETLETGHQRGVRPGKGSGGKPVAFKTGVRCCYAHFRLPCRPVEHVGLRGG